MRRPPIACRRAVQSLQTPTQQHIWISDEILTSALHRFSRSTCPHQKRHGSHVPGPLEARRRAAKRRMTMSADFYPQDSFPSSFNLGALFGYRSNPQPSWRYEPPSLQKKSDQLDTRTSGSVSLDSQHANRRYSGRDSFDTCREPIQYPSSGPISLSTRCGVLVFT
jgi:hypothetical protein